MHTKIIVFVMMLSIVLTGCNINTGDIQVKESSVKEIDEIISIVAAGDNLFHMPVINSGKQDDGTYDYSHIYEHLQPMIKEADISVIGQETVFAGEEYGYSGYPLFNSPSDVGKTLVREGFDIILHASNHVLDKWAVGIENTLSFWDNYPDIKVLGVNKSQEEKDTVNMITIKGANIALFNYTYGTNGLALPADKSYLVNYIDEEKIKKDVAYAEDNADFTIAFMHWGTEYSMQPDANQKQLCEKMCSWGVDLIIGSHPHVIEPVEWYTVDNGNSMLVYYSLGNFVSRQLEAKNLLGGLADVKLRFNGKNVTIDSYKFVPIITHYNKTYTDFDVYPLKEYTNDLAGLHGVTPHDGAISVEGYRRIVDEVFEGYDKKCLDY